MTEFIRKIRGIYLAIGELFVTNIPGSLGRILRVWYWRGKVQKMGRGVKIDVGVRIMNPAFLTIGNNTWIDNYAIILAGPSGKSEGPVYYKKNPEFGAEPGEIALGDNVHIANFVVLQGHGGLTIGSDTCIASGSMVYSMSHHHSNLLDRSDKKKYRFTSMVERKNQSLIIAPVVIGTASAIGLNSVVFPGVTVGDGSWIASGSVVSSSIPSNALASGNPAKVVKHELHPGWDLTTEDSKADG